MIKCNTNPHMEPGEHWLMFSFTNDSVLEMLDSF